MATSGSINFTLTRDNLITLALQDIGVLRDGGTPTSDQVTYCSYKLNMLIKHWEMKNLHVWSTAEASMFLTSGVNKYTLSGSTANSAGDNTIKTTLSAAASSTSWTCTTVTGMNVSDNIGIVLDSGSLYWTTITAINTTTKIVTVNTAASSAASSGAVVYAYTSTATKPLRILSVRHSDSAGNERIVQMKGRDDFMSIPVKSSPGPVNACFYTQGRDAGTMYVYLTPDDSSNSLNYSYARTIEDFDSSSDNADIPQEWLRALLLNLEVDICPHYGKDLHKQMPDLQRLAQEAISEATLWDVETGSSFIVPSWQYVD